MTLFKKMSSFFIIYSPGDEKSTGEKNVLRCVQRWRFLLLLWSHLFVCRVFCTYGAREPDFPKSGILNKELAAHRELRNSLYREPEMESPASRLKAWQH